MNDFYSSTNTDSDSYKDWTSPFTYDTHYDRRGWWYLRNSTTSSTVYSIPAGCTVHQRQLQKLINQVRTVTGDVYEIHSLMESACPLKNFRAVCGTTFHRSTFRWVETVHHTCIITTVKLIQTTFLLPTTTLLLIHR